MIIQLSLVPNKNERGQKQNMSHALQSRIMKNAYVPVPEAPQQGANICFPN